MGALPPNPRDLSLLRQDSWIGRRAALALPKSRPLSRRSGCVSAEPYPTLRSVQVNRDEEEKIKTSRLHKALDTSGEKEFHGQLQSLRDPKAFQQHLAPARQLDWVVYAKPPFGGAEQVIEYLGRYTHRIALSNQRLLAFQDGQVTFQYNDYSSTDPQRSRQMTASADEFVRRFLLHVIPPGFQRIRHYGLLTNRYRAENLVRCRELLVGPRSDLLPTGGQIATILALIVEPVARCPRCKAGIMIRVSQIPSIPWSAQPSALDSSC